MNSLWRTFGWDHARSEALVRRTRETGAKFLSRVASGARTIQHTLRVRREHLNRAPKQEFERRILAGLERVLERLGWGLRTRSDQLRPRETSSSESVFEADTPEMPTEAEIVRPEASTPPLKKRVSSRAPKSDTPKKGATPRVRVSARTVSSSRKTGKNGRVSTRWVSPPKVDLDALMSLSARELISKIPSLDVDTCRALLVREQAHKKRKTVMEALSARLPS